MSASKLFSQNAHTALYRAHRPHYPAALYDEIYKRVFPGLAAPFGAGSVAVDMATGSGQALGPMPEHFERVVAVDGSEGQLRHVPKELPSVEFKLADVHSTGLPNSFADLITVGQALHWFKLPEFYAECSRLLKPTGGMAAFSYDFGHFGPQAEKLSAAYERLHSGTLGDFWAKERKLVDNYYVGMEPGKEFFGRVERVQLPMDSDITFQQLVGQVRTWSAYHTFLQQHPDREDPVVAFERECMHELGLQQESVLQLCRKLTLLVATQPCH